MQWNVNFPNGHLTNQRAHSDCRRCVKFWLDHKKFWLENHMDVSNIHNLRCLPRCLHCWFHYLTWKLYVKISVQNEICMIQKYVNWTWHNDLWSRWNEMLIFPMGLWRIKEHRAKSCVKFWLDHKEFWLENHMDVSNLHNISAASRNTDSE
jgi:hypothetical protein